jgi:hypothetical protein
MKAGAPSRTAEYRALLRALESAHPDGERLLDRVHAEAFFAARKLALDSDESTTRAGFRLGVPRAHTTPDIYRLAALQLTPSGPPS